MHLNQMISNIKDIYSANNKKYAFTIGTVGAVLFGVFTNYYLKHKRKRLTSKFTNIIDSIPELRQANVKIKNPAQLENILANIIQDGKHRLQVISDFDRTISKYEINGQKCGTSNSVLENSRFVSPEAKIKFDNLRNMYLPIEMDSHMTKEEKTPFMVEWWVKSLNLTVDTNIHRDNIVEMVKQSTNVDVRDDCNWFFYTSERNDIPVMIFSAGIGNIVEEFIAQQCGHYKNMKIVSNFIKFNSLTNRICGFQGKLIHIFNKNESILLDTEYEKLIEKRNNVILIGDSLGDAHMADGIRTITNELKIGFLNDHVDKCLNIYMNKFDIVITEDPTFHVPNAILRSIIQMMDN